MDDNQQWLNPRPPANLPTTPPPERPKPPAPPPPEISVRTMKSDLESLKETGGTTPVPKPFTLQEFKKEVLPTPPLPPPPRPEGARLAPESGAAPQRITPLETGRAELPAGSAIEEEKAGGKGKKIAVWAGTLAVIVGVGLAGYYVIFPLFFPAQTPPPPPVFTAPPTEIPTVPTAEIPTATPHQSLLKSSAAVSSANLSTTDLTSLSDALQQEAQKQNPPGTLSELTLSNASGQLPAPAVFSALLPELSPENLKNLFEDDFTTALYFDENGAWPAYILKLKAEASPVEAQTEVAKIESSPNLRNLFALNPGTQGANFKSGQANGLATRYVAYSKKGAAINIAWSGDKLVISASYNGLKKVLSNL